jgi:transcriptional regulator with XRE-family HTH domain
MIAEVGQLPNLTSFGDYRKYLNILIENECATRPGLSMAAFAKSFGMSRSALSMVLSGARDVTLPFVHRIASALKLDHNDHALLVYLIDISDSPERVPQIAAQLGISTQHVRDVINSLQQEGFLSYKGHGNVHISFNRVAAMITSQQYMKSAFGEAIRQLERHFASPQHFFAVHSFSILEGDIKTFIEDYKLLVNKYSASTPSEAEKQNLKVVQLTTQLLPVL